MEEKRTRSKKSDEVKVEKKMPNTLPKRHIFFIDANQLESGQDIRIERLRHPSTEEASYFILHKATNRIFEVQQFNQKHRSWFINETVSSNGKCNITVPFDPLLFGVYYLQKYCSDKAMPIYQIIDDDYPKTTEILENLKDETILKIADRKGPDSLRAFKFNKDKTLAWLACKTELMITTLKNEKIQVSPYAISANYVKVDEDENLEDDYLRYACGIVGSYVTEELFQDLSEYLGIKDKPVNEVAKRKSTETGKNQQTSKKIKMEASVDVISLPPSSVQSQQKEKKETAKEKAMKKAASGSKSIASFFKK